jgi:hypothetical protein
VPRPRERRCGGDAEVAGVVGLAQNLGGDKADRRRERHQVLVWVKVEGRGDVSHMALISDPHRGYSSGTPCV